MHLSLFDLPELRRRLIQWTVGSILDLLAEVRPMWVAVALRLQLTLHLHLSTTIALSDIRGTPTGICLQIPRGRT